VSDTAVPAELVIDRGGPDLKKHPPSAIPAFRSHVLQPGDGPLRFRAAGESREVVLQPFYEIPAARPYSVYWRVNG
jgi:hypothetical protein